MHRASLGFALALAAASWLTGACGDSEEAASSQRGASSASVSASSAGGASAGGAGGGGASAPGCEPFFVPPDLFATGDGPLQLVSDGVRAWYADTIEGGRVGSIAREAPNATPGGVSLTVPAFSKFRLRRADARTWALSQRLDEDVVRVRELGADALVSGETFASPLPATARYEGFGQRSDAYRLFPVTRPEGVLTEIQLDNQLLPDGEPVVLDDHVTAAHWSSTLGNNGVVWFRKDGTDAALRASIGGAAPITLLSGATHKGSQIDRRVALTPEFIVAVVVDPADASAERLVWFHYNGNQAGSRPLEKIGDWTIATHQGRFFRGTTELAGGTRKAHTCFGSVEADTCVEVEPESPTQQYSFQDAARVDDGWVIALGVLDGGPAAPVLGFVCDP